MNDPGNRKPDPSDNFTQVKRSLGRRPIPARGPLSRKPAPATDYIIKTADPGSCAVSSDSPVSSVSSDNPSDPLCEQNIGIDPTPANEPGDTLDPTKPANKTAKSAVIVPPDSNSSVPLSSDFSPGVQDPRPTGSGPADHLIQTAKNRFSPLITFVRSIPSTVSRSSKNDKDKKPPTKKRLILKRALFATMLLFLIGAISLGVFVWVSVKDTPPWNPNALDNFSYASVVYDNTGTQIAQLSSLENRLHFANEDLPEKLIDTIIAVEDQRFYKHGGFDPLRIMRGAVNTALNPDKPEGGSTLTVQLAKNIFINVDNRSSGGIKGVQRKIQEIVLAMQIERNYEKDDILHAYLSQVYLGHGAFGVRSAALMYFGKELSELTPPEIAMICGLPQAPDTYDPYQHPESAKNRRTIILQIMQQEKIITAEEYNRYKEEPFTFVDKVKEGAETVKMGVGSKTTYPYFVDYVVSCLLDPNQYNLTSDQIYKGGLKIYTTVDPVIQQEAEQVMKDPANFPSNAKDGVQVQGAMVMLENATGNVVAMTGGREYPEDEHLCFNRASEAKRQPGSCAKPIMVYAPALDKGGFFTGTVLDDCPSTFGGGYSPGNAGGYSGLISMREAIRRSVNIYAVKLYQAAGPEHCFNFARDNLGLELKDGSSEYLSNALGAFEATPLEMARAYSAFPNQGMLNETHCVTKITDINDNTIMEPIYNGKRAMKDSTAYIMCDLMKDIVDNGTGTNARISNWFVGGKTGTTDSLDYPGGPDIWFTGYTPLYTASVWMGFDASDKDHYLPSGTYGGDRPARLWQKVMVKALEDKPRQTTIFAKPSNVISIQYDAFSGLRPSALTPSELIRSDLGTPEGMPGGVSNIWIELTVSSRDQDFPAWTGRERQITGVYLNMPSEFWTVMTRSAEKELKYKPPDKSSSGGKNGDNEEGSSGNGGNNNTLPQYKGTLSQNGNSITFSATVPNNTIYRTVYLYIYNSTSRRYVYATESKNLSSFSYTVPPQYRGNSSYQFQFVFRDSSNRDVSSSQVLTVSR